jgi:predicted ester cyclase
MRNELPPNKRQELYDIYLTKYREFNRQPTPTPTPTPTHPPTHTPIPIRTEDEARILKQANEQVYFQFLVHVTSDSGNKITPRKDIERFIHNQFPDALPFIDEIYNTYRAKFNRQTTKRKPKQRRENIVQANPNTLIYPFRSKLEKFKTAISKGDVDIDDVRIDERIVDDVDYRIKPLKKKFSRPSFGRYPYSWEIDHLQHDKRNITYLFAINVNTKYLYAFGVHTKDSTETKRVIRELIKNELEEFDNPVKNIRGDGDKGFKNVAREFPNINWYFQSSKFTFHNKIIDRVMATLRNALGPESKDFWDGKHDNQIQQLVMYYNNTYHREIRMTPIEMHSDVEKEWEYIRAMTQELNDVRKKQFKHNLLSLKEGDRVICHLNFAKTSAAFEKRRRNFEHTGTFKVYKNGNCLIKFDIPIGNDNPNKLVEIPIYFVKKLNPI